jgi:hypothetical protein
MLVVLMLPALPPLALLTLPALPPLPLLTLPALAGLMLSIRAHVPTSFRCLVDPR